MSCGLKRTPEGAAIWLRSACPTVRKEAFFYCADRAKREVAERMEWGFRFVLIRRDCVLADPLAFQSTNSTWKAADEFMVGDGVQRYRICDMVFSGSPECCYGMFLLEPGGNGGPA